MTMMRGKKYLAFLFLFLIPLSSSAQPTKNEMPSSQAKLQVEFGIDSLERKYYRPDFTFAWLPGKDKKNLLFAEFRYYESINSRLQGAVDFWLNAGYKRQLPGRLQLEARLNHFCRHLTCWDTPSVLDLNEVIGRLWLEEKTYRLGVGFGGYLGKEKGYDNLLIFNFELTNFLASEISFESEFKWVNFDQLLHEVGLSFALNESTELFIRNARYYQSKNTTNIGIRFKSEGKNEKYVDNFKLITGIYPFDDFYKLGVEANYKLAFFKAPQRRFFLDIDFFSPVLSGDDFFAQFYPDKMVYSVKGEYEKKIKDDLYLSVYATYNVDLPVDKDLPFRSNLGTGLRFKNQPDFDKPEKVIRYELAAGYNFKLDYDVAVKLGMNTRKKDLVNAGWNFLYQSNNEKYLVDFRVFADIGREVAIRPFIGLRKEKDTQGLEPSSESRVIVGIGLYKWF
jgi:hypothetical protein